MRTRDLAFIALFAALMVVLGLFPLIQVSLVPITAQSLGVMLAGSIIGARRGFLALLLFVVLALIGLPVLSGGRGGLGVLFGPTGGYLVAYPIAAFVIGLLTERFWRRYNVGFAVVANAVGGIVVVYLIGIPWLMAVAGLPLGGALVTGALPFLPGDVVKVAVASVAAVAVRRAYPIVDGPRERAATP